MQNFGIINETFKNILADGISTKGGNHNQIFRIYSRFLKENKILKSQYRLYNNLENKYYDDKLKSIEYIKESIALLKLYGEDNILKENNKLINFLTKNGYTLLKEDYTYKSLHKEIGNLIKNKKTQKNVDSLLESIYFINDFILNNKPKDKVLKESLIFSNKAVGEIAIQKFNEKYSNITEGEKKIIKSIIDINANREEIFKNSINECVELVNNNLTECTIDEKDKLLQVKDKLLRMVYNKDEFISEMIKIITLKNNLI